MSKISINPAVHDAGVYTFEIEISNDDSSTSHTVTLKESDYKTMTSEKIAPEALIEKSFEFLLSREPKESILRRFDLMEISRYFPEYIKVARDF